MKNWSGPEEGERPAAYIVILGDTEVSKTFGCDHGIAAQSIMLGALDKDGLREVLNISERYEILLALALGKPKETVVLEDTDADGDIRCYRDASDVHHVPKRPLDELIVQELA